MRRPLLKGYEHDGGGGAGESLDPTSLSFASTEQFKWEGVPFLIKTRFKPVRACCDAKADNILIGPFTTFFFR
ncbi:hypothetical protein LWI28_014114 [Acer negundo]|uniref:Uncharacterized protein n=1 Tax=Acer negundo TaxID=4023 RepID=A0AAD5IJC9_ACENE|nr:hypothetical protein LWI28_014114 [Acer negundo]